MKKALLLVVAFVFALTFAMGTANAGEYPNVVGLKPFTSQTAYLSLVGYIQYLSKNQEGKDLTQAEALSILNAQMRGEEATGEVKKVRKVRKHRAPKKAKTEEPKAEITAPKAEEPKAEAPKVEAPKVEEPKAEAPKVEAPKVEEPKAEAPKVEEPKAEAPKVEAPKAEEPKTK